MGNKQHPAVEGQVMEASSKVGECMFHYMAAALALENWIGLGPYCGMNFHGWGQCSKYWALWFVFECPIFIFLFKEQSRSCPLDLNTLTVDSEPHNLKLAFLLTFQICFVVLKEPNASINLLKDHLNDLKGWSQFPHTNWECEEVLRSLPDYNRRWKNLLQCAVSGHTKFWIHRRCETSGIFPEYL